MSVFRTGCFLLLALVVPCPAEVRYASSRNPSRYSIPHRFPSRRSTPVAVTKKGDVVHATILVSLIAAAAAGIFKSSTKIDESLSSGWMSHRRLAAGAPMGQSSMSAKHITSQLVHQTDAGFHFEVLHPRMLKAEAHMSEFTGCGVMHQQNRKVVTDWIFHYHAHFRLSEATLFLAVRLGDRLIASWRDARLPESRLCLAAAGALLVASKFEDEDPPIISEIVGVSKCNFTQQNLIHAELEVVQAVNYRLHEPTVAHHVKSYCSLLATNSSEKAMVHFLAELSLSCSDSSTWSPSVHAMAIITLAHRLFGCSVPGNIVELWGTHGDVARGDALNDIIADLSSLLLNAQFLSTRAVQRISVKFATTEHEHIPKTAAKLALTLGETASPQLQ